MCYGWGQTYDLIYLGLVWNCGLSDLDGVGPKVLCNGLDMV